MTFDDVAAEDLIAMGDGLLRDGNVGLAKGCYDVALRRASDTRMRQRARVRQGLAAAPTPRTLASLEVLNTLEAHRRSSAFVGDGLATWMKTLPFDEDDRFQELVQRHAALLPIANWHWNLTTVLWAVRAARDVPGDYVELGVFKGHTTLFCAEYVDFGSWQRRWWLYDTFTGIPEDQAASGTWVDVDANLYKGTFSYEEVATRFAHIPNVKIVQGRVPEVLRESAPESIAFLHVDLNNAPAEIGALDELFARLSPGGIIVFDDFCWETARGQYDAETEWFANRGLHILPLPTGQGVFVKR